MVKKFNRIKGFSFVVTLKVITGGIALERNAEN